MPANLAVHLVREYLSASSLPQAVWTTLHSHAAVANTILPHAEKVLKAEKQSQSVGSQLWLVCFRSHIEFILSCTEGPFGAYPIFIFTPIPFNELIGKDLDAPVSSLCRALLTAVGRRRVFSVFAVQPVTEAFVRQWSSLVNIMPVTQPFYDAIFTFCTKDRLAHCKRVAASQHVTLHKPSRTSRNIAVDLRRASLKDIDRVAVLCRDFSATSYPFILSTSRARQEAALLVKERDIWVLEITAEKEEPDIASIVAVSRKSKTVAAITKVFSKPAWRGLGCAEILVRHVCEELLVDSERVVLYVGKGNRAMNAYRRVGFCGLGTDQTTAMDGIEPWLEVGFDPAHVSLGHW
ncbi:hypothetical protein DFH29DRAFT_1000222 [Suillus ampliporus]|nr:hypothetical protein DFH29DRAFT_1000222 [Suillus ampliporus]